MGGRGRGVRGKLIVLSLVNPLDSREFPFSKQKLNYSKGAMPLFMMHYGNK